MQITDKAALDRAFIRSISNTHYLIFNGASLTILHGAESLLTEVSSIQLALSNGFYGVLKFTSDNEDFKFIKSLLKKKTSELNFIQDEDAVYLSYKRSKKSKEYEILNLSSYKIRVSEDTITKSLDIVRQETFQEAVVIEDTCIINAFNNLNKCIFEWEPINIGGQNFNSLLLKYIVKFFDKEEAMILHVSNDMLKLVNVDSSKILYTFKVVEMM